MTILFRLFDKDVSRYVYFPKKKEAIYYAYVNGIGTVDELHIRQMPYKDALLCVLNGKKDWIIRAETHKVENEWSDV